jgi:hypothetical protein
MLLGFVIGHEWPEDETSGAGVEFVQQHARCAVALWQQRCLADAGSKPYNRYVRYGIESSFGTSDAGEKPAADRMGEC